ncbi:MAG: heparinase II/III family protein, partial [Candidatus Omnitrophica bacterium]|nr:heparinase II/III family protein [Candidatus Omnitrophota bacterium]
QPTGQCLPGDSSLNLAIRLGTPGQGPGWLKLLEMFAPSPTFDDEFIESVLVAADWQLEWLENHLTGTGNWRIAELWCLLQAALVIPSRFARFGPQAARGLVTEFYSQVLSDGVHLERSAGYHWWMNFSFRLLHLIGDRLKPRVELEKKRLIGMDLFTLAQTMPDGSPCRFNDGAYVLNVGNSRILSARLKAYRKLRKKLGLKQSVTLDNVFPEAGLVFFRTAWGEKSTWVAFDVCTDFPGPHGHLSRLSLELHHAGRTLIPDPGIFSYEMSTWLGPAGKKTAGHATACVDWLNQADVGAQLLMFYSNRHFAFAHGRYTGGYWTGRYEWSFRQGRGTGLWGIHDRMLVWFKGRCLIVLDTVRTEPGHTIYLSYPLSPSPYQVDSHRSEVWTMNNDVNVFLKLLWLMAKPCPELKVYYGDRKAELGFLSTGFDQVVKSPLISWAFPTDYAETVTVILPFPGKKKPEVAIQAESLGRYRRFLQLLWPDGRRDTLDWVPGLSRAFDQEAHLEQLQEPKASLIARTAVAGNRRATIGIIEPRPQF